MPDPEVLAIATGAAATILADTVRLGWGRARTIVDRLFRHGTQDERDAALGALSRGVADDHLRIALASLLAAQAERRPEVLAELRSLAASRSAVPVVQVQRNEGSGTFIAGDVIGGLTINHDGSR
jgi:hypothetical protein